MDVSSVPEPLEASRTSCRLRASLFPSAQPFRLRCWRPPLPSPPIAQNGHVCTASRCRAPWSSATGIPLSQSAWDSSFLHTWISGSALHDFPAFAMQTSLVPHPSAASFLLIPLPSPQPLISLLLSPVPRRCCQPALTPLPCISSQSRQRPRLQRLSVSRYTSSPRAA